MNHLYFLQKPARSIPTLGGSEGGLGAAQFTVSDAGTLAYVAGAAMNVGTLVWVNRDGSGEEQAWPGMEPYGAFQLSPDAKKLAISIARPNHHLWVYDFEDGKSVRLTSDSWWPTWTPDSLVTALWGRLGEGYLHLYNWRADGSSRESLSSKFPDSFTPESWSPDRRVLTVTNWARSGRGSDILTLRGDKNYVPEPFLTTEAGEWDARFSPDGKWIAYTGDESGSAEVYVRPYPATKPRHQISIGGGEEPMWAPDGQKLFYRINDRWMAVRVSTEPQFNAAPPELLFQAPYMQINGRSYSYDHEHDRFLVLKGREETPVTEIHIVQNWFEELKRLVPTGKKR